MCTCFLNFCFNSQFICLYVTVREVLRQLLTVAENCGSFFNCRLRDELEHTKLKYEESVNLLKSKHMSEIEDLTDHLKDVEISRQELLNEITSLKQREEELRQEIIQEQEETLEALHRKWEHGQKMLEEDYNKVCAERDEVSGYLCPLLFFVAQS